MEHVSKYQETENVKLTKFQEHLKNIRNHCKDAV